MFKRRNFLFVILPVFLILHFLGWYKAYYDLAGYDKVVHFLAGGCVVLVILWFLEIKEVKTNRGLISLLILFFVSILWEVLEYLTDRFFGRPLAGLLQPMQISRLDTLGDFLLDCAGGFFILFFVHFGRRNKGTGC